MTTEPNWLSAGLVFQGSKHIDIVAASNRVSNTFDALGQRVTGIRILSDSSAQISSQHHEVKVQLHEDHPVEGLTRAAPLFLSLEAARRTKEPPEGTPMLDSVLAHSLKALNWTLSADYVQWVEPGAVLDSADFIMATSQLQDVPVAPRRVAADRQADPEHRCHRLPSIEETNELLQERMAQKQIMVLEAAEAEGLRSILTEDAAPLDPAPPLEDIREDTAPLRLSVWMISFIISLFALPVGVALMVVNLLKGENLRLASQTAALTGMFISFQAYGTTAQAMTVLQTIAN